MSIGWRIMLNFFAWVATIAVCACLMLAAAVWGWSMLAVIVNEPWGAAAGAIAGILVTLAAVAWYQIRRVHRREGP